MAAVAQPELPHLYSYIVNGDKISINNMDIDNFYFQTLQIQNIMCKSIIEIAMIASKSRIISDLIKKMPSIINFRIKINEKEEKILFLHHAVALKDVSAILILIENFPFLLYDKDKENNLPIHKIAFQASLLFQYTNDIQIKIQRIARILYENAPELIFEKNIDQMTPIDICPEIFPQPFYFRSSQKISEYNGQTSTVEGSIKSCELTQTFTLEDVH